MSRRSATIEGITFSYAWLRSSVMEILLEYGLVQPKAKRILYHAPSPIQYPHPSMEATLVAALPRPSLIPLHRHGNPEMAYSGSLRFVTSTPCPTPHPILYNTPMPSLTSFPSPRYPFPWENVCKNVFFPQINQCRHEF